MLGVWGITADDSAGGQVAVGAFAQPECDCSGSGWVPLNVCGLAGGEGEALGDFEGVGTSGRLRKNRS